MSYHFFELSLLSSLSRAIGHLVVYYVLEKSSFLMWSFYQIKTLLTVRICLLSLGSHFRIPVICLSCMQICSSIEKKWDFKSKNMGGNQDQRCCVGWGFWYFLEIQEMLMP